MEEGSTRKRNAEQAFGKDTFRLNKQRKEVDGSSSNNDDEFEAVFFRECTLFKEDPQALNEFEELVKHAELVPERELDVIENYKDNVLSKTFPSRFLPFVHRSLMFLYLRNRKNEERKAKEKAQENEKSSEYLTNIEDDRRESFQNLCVRWILFSFQRKQTENGDGDETTCFFLVELMGLINDIKKDFGEDDHLPTRYQRDCTLAVSLLEDDVNIHLGHVFENALELLYRAKHPSIIIFGCAVLSKTFFASTLNHHHSDLEFREWIAQNRMRILNVVQPLLAHTRSEVRKRTALISGFIGLVIQDDYQPLWQDIVARVSSINFMKVSEEDALFMATLGQLVFILVADYLSQMQEDEDSAWRDEILPFLLELMERVTEPLLVVDLFHCVARLAGLEQKVLAHFDRLVPLLIRFSAYPEPKLRLVDTAADKINAKSNEYNLSILPEDLKDLLIHRSNIKKVQMIREKRFQKKSKSKEIYRSVRSHAAATLDMLSTSARSEEVVPHAVDFLLRRSSEIENSDWISREQFALIMGAIALGLDSLKVKTLFPCLHRVSKFLVSDPVGKVKATCCWTISRYLKASNNFKELNEEQEKPQGLTLACFVPVLVDHILKSDQSEEELIKSAGTTLLELIEDFPVDMMPYLSAVFDTISQGASRLKGDALLLLFDMADVLFKVDVGYEAKFSDRVVPTLVHTLEKLRKLFEESRKPEDHDKDKSDSKDIQYYTTLLNAIDMAFDVAECSLNENLLKVLIHCCIFAFNYEVFDEGLCRASLELLSTILNETNIQMQLDRKEEFRNSVLRALPNKAVQAELFAFFGDVVSSHPDLLWPISNQCFEWLLASFSSSTLAIANNAIWAFGELLGHYPIDESKAEKFLLALQSPSWGQFSDGQFRKNLSATICLFVRYNATHLHNTPQHNLAMLLTHVLDFDPVDVSGLHMAGLKDLWAEIVSTEDLTNRIAFLSSLIRLRAFLSTCDSTDHDWMAQVDERIDKLQ